MFGVCILFTVVILALLVARDLVSLVSIGAQSLRLAFFTELPIPKGMPGYPGRDEERHLSARAS